MAAPRQHMGAASLPGQVSRKQRARQLTARAGADAGVQRGTGGSVVGVFGRGGAPGGRWWSRSAVRGSISTVDET